MKHSVTAETLPPNSLLARYEAEGHYTDCYQVVISRSVALGDFIGAFYCTWLFRLERRILAHFLNRPSTDADVTALAKAETETFAAWQVEARGSDEILLCDMRGATRSWLAVAVSKESGTTALRFGSAVVMRDGEVPLSYRLLLGFHKLYSRALLALAHRQLR